MKIDSETVLVSLSVLLAFVSTVLFITTGIFISPVTDAVLVFTLGSVLMYLTVRTGQNKIKRGGRAIFTVSFVSSIIYLVVRLTSGQVLLSAVIGLIAVLFLIVAYLQTKNSMLLTERRIAVLSVISLGLLLVTAGVDITTGEPQYQVDLNQNVSEIDGEYGNDYSIGEVRVVNPSPLPRKYELPRYQTCLTGNSMNSSEPPRVPDSNTVYYEDTPSLISGRYSTDILVRYPVGNLSDASVKSSDTCPDESENLTVHFLGDN